MVHETQLVQDFAQQATLDLQSVLPALQVRRKYNENTIQVYRFHPKPQVIVMVTPNRHGGRDYHLHLSVQLSLKWHVVALIYNIR